MEIVIILILNLAALLDPFLKGRVVVNPMSKRRVGTGGVNLVIKNPTCLLFNKRTKVLVEDLP